MIEYWSGTDYTFPQEAVTFKLKLDTDLYALAKAKTSSKSLEISKDGSQFATFSMDRSDKLCTFAVPLVLPSGFLVCLQNFVS